MAQRLDESCKIGLKVSKGLDESGKEVTATRSLANINPDMSDDDALYIGGKFGALQKYTVKEITRSDSAVLTTD